MAGRKKRSLLDVMRTKLWLGEMLRGTGMHNINQLGELLADGDIKKMLYRYAAGENTVSAKMPDDIDARVRRHELGFEGGRQFFQSGQLRYQLTQRKQLKARKLYSILPVIGLLHQVFLAILNSLFA